MSKAVIYAEWKDVPHLSPETQAELLASIPPYQRDARSKGIPQLGSGAIYPVPESDIVVPDFELPAHYPRGYGLDVGWERTAGIWGALDRETDCVYLYSEHYRGHAEPIVHSAAIKARGEWVPGFIDPAANGRSQVDGQRLFALYRAMGLQIRNAANAREAGIHEVWMRLSTGRLKVFASCRNWLMEFRIFMRDEKGRIMDESKFHLMASTRYLLLNSVDKFKVKPAPKKDSISRPTGIVWG